MSVSPSVVLVLSEHEQLALTVEGGNLAVVVDYRDCCGLKQRGSLKFALRADGIGDAVAALGMLKLSVGG